MNASMRVLVLGGTAEARSLSAALARTPELAATVSLAGVTLNPALYDLPTRRGGFGGVEGLERYLAANRIDALVDATHPFAATISANAVTAARNSGIRYLNLMRPPWRPRANEHWRDVPDLGSVAKALRPGGRVFLATGPGSSAHFAALANASVVLRVIALPKGRDLPPHWTIITARPPFSIESEIVTFRKHGVTHLVARNSGGDEGRAKLDAAAALDIEIVMIARPAPPAGVAAVTTVADALAWLGAAGHVA